MSQEQQLVLLRQYLDAEQSVSCRWLANALDVTIDASKELLQLYKGKNQDIFASYYVSGKKSDVAAAGHVALALEVVPEDRLDECKKKYTTLSSVYIYSLQRTARYPHTFINFITLTYTHSLLVLIKCCINS